jgi:hypothetical protein
VILLIRNVPLRAQDSRPVARIFLRAARLARLNICPIGFLLLRLPSSFSCWLGLPKKGERKRQEIDQ